MRTRLSSAGRGRIAVLLALALFVRALVPTGWMPVATAHGLTFELCESQGPAVAEPAMHHDGKEHGKAALPDHPCAFAGIGLAADLAPPPVLLAASLAPDETTPSRPFAVAIGQGLAAPPPPATGPPAFA